MMKHKGYAMEFLKHIPNEIWWILTLVADFGMALLMFTLFKREGLLVFIIMNILVCNLQVAKTVPMFGFVTTLGNIAYGSIYWATDLLGEVYGKKEARKGVWYGFFALIYMTVMLQLAVRYAPIDDAVSLSISDAMNLLYGFIPAIAIGSLTAYVISQFHDIWAFHFWRKKTGEKHLWLRNNASTIVSQTIDTTVFTAIAFLTIKDGRLCFLYPFKDIVSIFWTTLVIKIFVAICDTPFIYWGRSLAKKWGEGRYAPDAPQMD